MTMQMSSRATSLIRVSVTKAIVTGGAYSAEDVISEVTTNNASTAYVFANVVNYNGAGGYIVRAQVLSETTNIAPRLTLYLFNALPTSELDDNAANTAVLNADLANYVGKIDFSAMADMGGDSSAIATPSTYGNLPLAFKCSAISTSLWGILVTADVFTQTAGDDMTVTLFVEN